MECKGLLVRVAWQPNLDYSHLQKYFFYRDNHGDAIAIKFAGYASDEKTPKALPRCFKIK